jgi:V8-like Glu-specific endopeptidase
MYDNYVKGDEGLATKSDDDLYAYQMDTEGGQSGGPLLLSGTQQAIGVHIFGRSNINNAAAVTAEFISWVNRHSA